MWEGNSTMDDCFYYENTPVPCQESEDELADTHKGPGMAPSIGQDFHRQGLLRRAKPSMEEINVGTIEQEIVAKNGQKRGGTHGHWHLSHP